MALNSNSVASKVANEYEALKASGVTIPPQVFLDFLARTIDAGYQAATPTFRNINLATSAGTLKFPEAHPSQMAMIIATNCCLYLQKTITPTGIPAVGNTIVSVVNNASVFIAPMYADIMAIYNGTIGPISYLELIEAIYKHSKKIEWIVTEIVGKGVTVVITKIT